ncbi:hypothetical protein LJC56_00115 [Christensenellaceae bacterium OttesenSCG-928-K19]|nr:hypothetical protein [Christensenellaceae bacterium OttesenSCG-928-K19]
MNNTATATHTRGALIGVSVCPACKVINKIRTSDEVYEGKCKCQSCGEEISIDKVIKK